MATVTIRCVGEERTRHAMAGDRVPGRGGASASDPSDRRIELVVQSLLTRLGATTEPELIRAEVEAGFAAFDGARIRDFVPVLVEARVRSRLVAHRRRPQTPDGHSHPNTVLHQHSREVHQYERKSS
jgi:hypothetical protein